MPAKVRILTRRFDLVVEGESVEEVERLMGVIEGRGLLPRAAELTATAGVPDASSEHAQSTATTGAPQQIDLRGPAVASLDEFGGAPTQPLLAPSTPQEIRLVTKRNGDVIVLSPKFPPGPDGAERVEAAAMVILAGYDAASEAPITGSRLVKSLRNTGYHLERVDRALDNLRQKGLIMVSGMRRGRTYQLSEAGKTEARRLASELAAQVGLAGQINGGTGA